MKHLRPRRFFAGAILFFLLAALGVSALVMLLWNQILVPLLAVSAIGIWQAAGILVLSRLLFSRFPGGRGFGWHGKRRMMMQEAGAREFSHPCWQGRHYRDRHPDSGSDNPAAHT